MSENGKKSKRGRKPKIKVSEPPMIKKEINSEEEPLISHLNISLKDILNNNSENSSPLEEDSIMTASESDSIFIKNETKPTNFHNSDDLTKISLCGLSSLLIFQTFIHIGVNTSLLPTTGMTLPFLSYGGSSLIGSSILAGVILNLTKNRYKNE